jgi:hypothetical protein
MSKKPIYIFIKNDDNNKDIRLSRYTDIDDYNKIGPLNMEQKDADKQLREIKEVASYIEKKGRIDVYLYNNANSIKPHASVYKKSYFYLDTSAKEPKIIISNKELTNKTADFVIKNPDNIKINKLINSKEVQSNIYKLIDQKNLYKLIDKKTGLKFEITEETATKSEICQPIYRKKIKPLTQAFNIMTFGFFELATIASLTVTILGSIKDAREFITENILKLFKADENFIKKAMDYLTSNSARITSDFAIIGSIITATTQFLAIALPYLTASSSNQDFYQDKENITKNHPNSKLAQEGFIEKIKELFTPCYVEKLGKESQNIVKENTL